VGFFEGYYVKCCGDGGTAAFIFGRQAYKREKSAFVQVITADGSHYAEFDYNGFFAARRGFEVRVGKNYAEKSGLFLDIDLPDLKVCGEVKFGAFSPLRYDAMGPFKLLPFMECCHKVVSMSHGLSGQISINGRVYNFDGGRGYIEGDHGKSFPQKYLCK